MLPVFERIYTFNVHLVYSYGSPFALMPGSYSPSYLFLHLNNNNESNNINTARNVSRIDVCGDDIYFV